MFENYQKMSHFYLQFIKMVEKPRTPIEDLVKLIEIIRNFFLHLSSDSSLGEKHPSYLSVIQQDLSQIQMLCRYVPEVNKVYKIAAEKQCRKVLDFFVKYMQNGWFEVDTYHTAAKYGHLEGIQILTQNMEDKNPKSASGYTPLDFAIESGNFPIVKIIMNEIEEKNPYSGLFGTALHTAAHYGDCDIFKYIFELSNEEKNPTNVVNSLTPLHHAASNGHFSIVEMILEEIEDDSKIPIDSRGVTPLHEAALRGHEDIVNLLLDNSEQDKNHSDYDGNTPLLNAARNGHDRIVQLILDKVPTDELKDFNGRGPLHLAVEKADFLAVETLTEPECYSQLSVFDDEANTPLHLAAEMNHETILKRLLEVAEDKNPANVHRVTPLHCAAQHGSDTGVKLIMNEVSDVHPVNSIGETPLDLALNEGHTNVIELLRKHKKARLY